MEGQSGDKQNGERQQSATGSAQGCMRRPGVVGGAQVYISPPPSRQVGNDSATKLPYDILIIALRTWRRRQTLRRAGN